MPGRLKKNLHLEQRQLLSVLARSACSKRAKPAASVKIFHAMLYAIDLLELALEDCWMFDRLKISLLVLGALSLSACGGGGSESDGTVPLALSPAKIDVSSPGCASAVRGPEVKVAGGDPPYFIHNPFPHLITLSTNVVQRAGETFRVDLVGGTCLTDITLQVTDRDANSIDFVLNYTPTTSE